MLERDQGGGVLISPSGGLETTGSSAGENKTTLCIAYFEACCAEIDL